MTRIRILSTVLLLPLLFPGILRADEVDDFVQSRMREQHIPGMSMAVVKEGKVVKARGYGLANIEHGVVVKPETIFQSGSVGKQFTATAVMMLVEDSKLGLDDEVSRYLDKSPESWKGMTVRHLLAHTSGIKNYTGKDFDYRQDYSETDFLKKVATFSPDFVPGEDWRYSNTGYALLGMIIRKASGKFYGDFLRERVFMPLGMDTARIISEADIVPNRSAGYRRVRGQLKNQEWVSPSLNTMADGSLYLTVLDMAKWDAALYGEKLLKKPNLDLMWTPVKTKDGKSRDYGFGWRVADMKGHRVIEHGGKWQGFAAAITRFPDDKLTVIVLTNLAGASPDKVTHGVARLYIPELGPAN